MNQGLNLEVKKLTAKLLALESATKGMHMAHHPEPTVARYVLII
jgi:hypothetical protein